MSMLGQNFPLSAANRQQKLKEIRKNSDPVSTVKVPGRGQLNVYRIPLNYLTYNKLNTRFIAQAKTLEAKLGRPLDDENPDDISKIEDFLWDYKKDSNILTINSLIKDGQLTPGVVTIDGIILAGNRRFRLLNEIIRNPDKYDTPTSNIDNLHFFEAAIINEVLKPKAIVKFESFYQYGTEDKVDYDPISKYIAAHFQHTDLGYTTQEIANNFMTITQGKSRVVEDWLEVFNYMNEYLDYIGEKEIYTSLENKEEAFLNLKSTLKSLTTGKASKEGWDYDDFDLLDLRRRYYDYIWADKETHGFRQFKKFFLNKERWEVWNKNVLKVVTEADKTIDSLDVYRQKHPDIDVTTASEMRSNDYKAQTENQLNKLYGSEFAFHVSKEEEETPLKIAQQALQKLQKLEDTLISTEKSKIADIDELAEKVLEVQKLAGKIKQRID